VHGDRRRRHRRRDPCATAPTPRGDAPTLSTTARASARYRAHQPCQARRAIPGPDRSPPGEPTDASRTVPSSPRRSARSHGTPAPHRPTRVALTLAASVHSW
jgi:hypothetical protein